MSDSLKGFWAVSAFAYSSHYFSNGVSLCRSYSYDSFFSRSFSPCDKKLCKKCLKALNKIQSKEPKDA